MRDDMGSECPFCGGCESSHETNCYIHMFKSNCECIALGKAEKYSRALLERAWESRKPGICHWYQWDQHSDEYFSTDCDREFQWATPYDLPNRCPGCGKPVVRSYKPKVLAADGHPIHLGDTLHAIHGGFSCCVRDIRVNANGRETIVDEDGSELLANGFTHDKPSIGADGNPIVVGDMLHILENPFRFVALRTCGDIVTVASALHPNDEDYRVEAKLLTHVDFDTDARVLDDVREIVQKLSDKYEDGDTLWVPSELEVGNQTVLEAITDIIDRQKIIDGRKVD